MRDVSAKSDTLRKATAEAVLVASPSTITLIREGKAPKGDPLPVARVAGIQAAKATPTLIPYCHSVPLDHVSVEFEILEDRIRVVASATAIYKTGVEMEALTAAAVAALNLYDMLKIIDEEMEIVGVRLLSKTGGKSDFRSSTKSRSAAVIVVSDSISAGSGTDRSGPAIRERLEAEGFMVAEIVVISDDIEEIRTAIGTRTTKASGASTGDMDLLVLTGGTGLGPRDVTPEALAPLLEKRLEGIEEAIRNYGQRRTPLAMLSRSMAGAIGNTIVLALPGSPAGVADALQTVFPALHHAIDILHGGGH